MDDIIYSDGLYTISAIPITKWGNLKRTMLHGHIVDINTPTKTVPGRRYKIGSHIFVPRYENESDEEPLFKTIEEIKRKLRNDKIDSIL